MQAAQQYRLQKLCNSCEPIARSAYAFTAHALTMFALQGAKTPHEELEDIEILRFIEMGMTVRMIEVDSVGIAIDTPEDLERAKQYLARNQH